MADSRAGRRGVRPDLHARRPIRRSRLSVYQLPGSNALETARSVREKMEELKARFPAGLDYAIVYDTTPFINESINEVFKTLRDAVILVAFVVLLVPAELAVGHDSAGRRARWRSSARSP